MSPNARRARGRRHRPSPDARAMRRHRTTSSPDDPDVLCRDADRARELGEHDRAVRLYHRALRTLKSPPGSAPPSPRVSSVYARVASCERAMGRLASAIEALERSVRWDDGWPGGWMALGEARLEARRFEGAVEAFEAFCERCDGSELERGRRMSRVARSMASGEGLGRGAEEEPRRREEVPEERDDAGRDARGDDAGRDERGDDDVDFYIILDDARRALRGFITRTSRFVTAKMLSNLRRVGRLHELPKSIERDSKMLLGCALFAVAFAESTCARIGTLRGGTGVHSQWRRRTEFGRICPERTCRSNTGRAGT